MFVKEEDIGKKDFKKKKKEKNIVKVEKPFIKFDSWQKEILEVKGNKVICSGRQTGKSTVVAALASDFVVNNPNKSVLIISVTEDQAIELLNKCLWYLESKHSDMVHWKGPKMPRKEHVNLINGSTIRTKAVGQSGTGVRGFTIDMLIADEAAWMPKDVWAAVTPMLLTTGGDIILISTPHGKTGFFYDCYNDKEHFSTFHINSLEAIEKREISHSWSDWQRTKALAHIEAEKLRMSDKEFGQEYLGQFIEELGQFYNDAVILKSLIYKRRTEEEFKPNKTFYLGVDIARMGGDLITFEIVERRGDNLTHRENIVWKRALLSEITQKILLLDSEWNFKKIYIDDGGIGVGVFDYLLTNPKTKTRVVPINNAKRVIGYNPDGSPKNKTLMKEDIHNNLLHLMELGKIMILDDSTIYQSFKSVQYEYTNEKGGAMMRIFGSNTHVVEALARAAWCVKDKLLYNRISYL